MPSSGCAADRQSLRDGDRPGLAYASGFRLRRKPVGRALALTCSTDRPWRDAQETLDAACAARSSRRRKPHAEACSGRAQPRREARRQ